MRMTDEAVMHESWSRLTREDLRRAIEPIVVVPVGSTEQHGYHLPLGTDAILAEAVARRLAARWPTLRVGPVLPIGYSPHHFPYRGTVSWAADTLLAVLRDTIASLARTGFRRVWLLSGHGGNEEIVRLAARTASQTDGVAVAACCYWQPAASALQALWARWFEVPPPIPGHAGCFETSLMLAVAPTLVHTQALPTPGKTPYQSDDVIARPGSFAAFDGYTDDPHPADANYGEQSLAVICEALGPIAERLGAIPL